MSDPCETCHQWHYLGLACWEESDMKLETWHSSAEKALWKIVRLDTYVDVEGDIISADESTGECSLQVGAEAKTFSFGPNGMRIVGRGR
jgi:hypothetical protein